MTSFLVSWLVLSVAVWATAKLLPGVELEGFASSFFVAAIFGLMNFLFGWLLWLAFGVLTLGLGWLLWFITRWFVDAVLLKLTDGVLESFRIRSFGTALLAALLMSGFGTLGEWLLHFAGVI